MTSYAALVARGQRGLDLVSFFVANVQTGFGPFIAVYLTSEAWTQREIGAALSVGTIAAMASQVPGGALVDWLTNKRMAAFLACVALAISALMFALWPTRPSVMVAEVLHGFASCMLGPAIAAISLQLVGHSGLGERLGRNASFAAIGAGVAAAVMGASGTYVAEQSVFYLTAILMVPGILALRMIPMRPAEPVKRAASKREGLLQSWRLFIDRRLLMFAACVGLFHLSNAALLPLAAGEMTRRLGSSASLVIAACIVVPQVLVAVLSPFVGRAADRWGRRPVLVLGFLALPVRAVLLAVVHDPLPLILVQALDGLAGATFGIMLPLVAADLTRGTNRFNLCLGALGLAIGAGATLSTWIAGLTADLLGPQAAFLVLAGCGMAAVLLALVGMSETRDRVQEPAVVSVG